MTGKWKPLNHCLLLNLSLYKYLPISRLKNNALQESFIKKEKYIEDFTNYSKYQFSTFSEQISEEEIIKTWERKGLFFDSICLTLKNLKI